MIVSKQTKLIFFLMKNDFYHGKQMQNIFKFLYNL